MKRLGVWLPRWNHMKTLLPVMCEANRRGIRVEVVCGESEGKPELSAAPIIQRLAAAWPWAHWGVALGSDYDAIIAHGVVHDAEVIKRSGVPWVAVDHLGENAWWYLTGHPEMWDPWHRVCLSGEEGEYLPNISPWTGKAVRTGYTALDRTDETLSEIRKSYGLPDRYMLVGTAVHASTIPAAMWRAYRGRSIGRFLGLHYTGPTYGKILTVLHDYARATGMAFVGKGRWKHEGHSAHRMFDHYFDDEPTDPGRAFRLMRGAAMYAGGISGLAVEALGAHTPTVNWTYYPPLMADHRGFRILRQNLWVDGIWQAPGIGRLFKVYEPEGWKAMLELLNTTGPGIYHNAVASYPLMNRVVGMGHASHCVLDACGL